MLELLNQHAEEHPRAYSLALALVGLLLAGYFVWAPLKEGALPWNPAVALLTILGTIFGAMVTWAGIAGTRRAQHLAPASRPSET